MESFEIDGVTFSLDTRPGAQRDKSRENHFVLVKSRSFLDYYDRVSENHSFKNLLEIGMFEGGSLVYFDKRFAPEKIIGVDIRKDPIDPLETYVDSRNHIQTHYNTSQDSEELVSVIKREFPEGIDVVVDDASHHYELTKKTFENVFPYLKEGGLYIVEDWAWAHTVPNQNPKAPWAKMPAMSKLLFEICVNLVQDASIESIEVRRELFAIVKGKNKPFEAPLDIKNSMRGKSLGNF